MTLAEIAAKLRKAAAEAERQRVVHVGTDTIVAEQYLGYKLGYEQALSLLEADSDFTLRERLETFLAESHLLYNVPVGVADELREILNPAKKSA